MRRSEALAVASVLLIQGWGMMFPLVLWDDRVKVRLRMLISQSLGRKEPNVEGMGRA